VPVRAVSSLLLTVDEWLTALTPNKDRAREATSTDPGSSFRDSRVGFIDCPSGVKMLDQCAVIVHCFEKDDWD
jgi:hypothetical protein